MLGKAFTFVFDDPAWVEKLIMMVMFCLLSLIPVLGLIPFAVVIGYMIAMIRRMQKGEKHPLGTWINIDQKLSDGATVLVAMAFYHLPVLLAVLIQMVVPGIAQDEGVRGIIALISASIIVPITLAYVLVAWLMLGVGCVRFARTKHGASFYDFNALFRIAYLRIGSTMQWLVLAIVTNIIFLMIPCIGWLLGTAFLFPIQGFLLGTLAVSLQPLLDEQKASPDA